MYVMYSGKVTAERISWQPRNISVWHPFISMCALQDSGLYYWAWPFYNSFDELGLKVAYSVRIIKLKVVLFSKILLRGLQT